MTNLSRRTVLAGAAIAAVPFPAFAVSGLSNPDAELLALEPEWREAFAASERDLTAYSRAEDAYFAARRNGTATPEQAGAVERADARSRVSLERLSEIEETILNAPVSTLAGAAFKARMVQAYEDVGPEMVHGLVEAVLGLADRG